MRIGNRVGKSLLLAGISGLMLTFTNSLLLAQEVVGPKVGVFDGERVLAESEVGQEAIALINQLQEQRVWSYRHSRPKSMRSDSKLCRLPLEQQKPLN